MHKVESLDLSKKELHKKYSKLKVEHNALIESSRAILSYEDFETAAKEIFDYCKRVTGATSGYVALLSEDGSENEVLFLDSGGLECTVDESLPMPIRGLRSKAYNLLKGVYDNNFANSKWVKYMPSGHMRLENVLFAPLIINNKAEGLTGLANKDGGFNDRDLSFISILGDIAALSLKNNRNLDLLKESERKYRLITEYASDVIWVYNYNHKKFSFISPSIYKLTGYSVERAIKTSLKDSFAEQSFNKLRIIIENKINKLISNNLEEISFVAEVKQLCNSGKTKWIELSANIHFNKENEILITGLSRDIEDRKKIENELLYISSHDQLTNLYNRRYFVNAMEEMEKLDSYPIAIISADIDGLKNVNDTKGHKAGDEYIKLCSKILKSSIRIDSLLARVGGDEFAILLPKTNLELGRKVLLKVKNKVEKYNKENKGFFNIGISLGIAIAENESKSLEETYNLADKRMYQDKRNIKE